jgi:hypothetical protein
MTSKNDQSHYKPAASQVVAYTGTAGTSTAINTYTNVVRLLATTAAFIRFGGTAVANDMYLPAGVAEYFTINGGDTISAIQVASGGSLYITEMTQ